MAVLPVILLFFFSIPLPIPYRDTPTDTFPAMCLAPGPGSSCKRSVMSSLVGKSINEGRGLNRRDPQALSAKTGSDYLPCELVLLLY